MSDILRLRQFCRVYLNAVPDDTTLIRWANLIQPKTLEKFNERFTQLAIERKVTSGRKMRTDGTVVESNIRPPSDGRLLSDSVRVLARTVARGQTILKTVRKKVLDEFEDFTQTAKGLSRKIGETLRRKKKEAQAAGRQQYEKLLAMTGQTIDWALQTQKQLQKQSQGSAKRLVETLNHFIQLARQVIHQTTRRILKGVLDNLERRFAEPHDDPWEAREFQSRELAANNYLLTYTLIQSARVTRRPTIWRRHGEVWKIVYHQGTIVETPPTQALRADDHLGRSAPSPARR